MRSLLCICLSCLLLHLAHPSTATPLNSLSSTTPRTPSHAINSPSTSLLQPSKRKLIISTSRTHAITLRTYSSLLPLPIATAALHTFYANLLSRVEGPWAYWPELPVFSAEWGNIRMDLRAQEGYVIPWSFVAEFAAKMITVTERGFASVYEGDFCHLATGAAIEIGVRVVVKGSIWPE